LISTTALFGCSSDTQSPGSAVASAGASNSAGATTGGAGGGSNASGGSSALGSAGRIDVAGGPNFNLDPDAGATDPDAGNECSHLNIGIFGKPGTNASSNFQQWLEASGTSAQRTQTNTGEPLTSATLQPFDVVVLDHLQREYTAEEAATFATWVSAGGGVVSMTGYEDDPNVDWRANSLLAPLGVAYSGSRVDGPIQSFATHPVTAGITSVSFVGGYSVSELSGAASTRTPIAFDTAAGNAAHGTVGFAVQMGKGHAVVWGDEWIEFDSEWSALPQITRLWVQVFAWIAPVNKCELSPPK